MLREDVEVHTDQQVAGAIRAFGDNLDELLQILTPWGEAVRAAHGYPASGPHDLAKLTGTAGTVRT